MSDVEVMVEVNSLAEKSSSEPDVKTSINSGSEPDVKTSINSAVARKYDPEAFAMAHDAVNQVLTSYYLIPPDLVKNPKDLIGTVGSVWGSDTTRLDISGKLKSWIGRTIMRILAVLILIASMFEQPRIWPEIPYAVGWSIVAVILAVFWIVFISKMWCMMPTKSKHWFQGAEDEVWTIWLGVCLLMSTLGLILEMAEVDVEECNTIHQSSVKFNRAALWLRISRIYYIPYFAPRLRDGIISSIQILKSLVEIFGLIIVCFLCHYFAYDAAMDHDEVCTTSAGVTSCTSEWKQNLGNDSGEAKDGIWNMFILLTTANHPDVVMNFYDASPASFLMLVSFMLLTFYFLMNLLLGEVYSTYHLRRQEQIHTQKSLQAALINSCYNRLEEFDLENNESGIKRAAFDQIIAHSRPTTQEKKLEIWFAMLDNDQSGFIERDEFQKFEEVRDAPLRRKDEDEVSCKEHTLADAKAEKKQEQDRSKFTMRKDAVDKAETELKEAEEEREKQQNPVFPGLNSFFVKGSLADARPKNEKSAHKVGDDGWFATPAVKNSFLHYVTWCNFVDALTALSIGYMAFTDADATCGSTWALSIEITITTVFILDVFFRIFAEMIVNNRLAFFNTNFYNYIDMAAAVIMFLNLMLCTGNGSATEARSAVAIVRVLRCLRLAHSIKSLRMVLKVAQDTLMMTAPQLILFLMIYYGFGTLGMALFTGDTTKVTLQGGPGDWSTAPWASTAYGSTAYYSSLNFDNIGRSFFTLFTLMVQNNWSVTADGFMQTNDRWSRIYFFVFNITAVMLMINIFVATVMSFYSELYKNMKIKEHQEEVAKERNLIMKDSLADKLLEEMVTRLENVPEAITKGQWFIKMKVEDAADIIDKKESEEKTQQKQDRIMLDHFPLGICIQEVDGKYTWANKAYKQITITQEKRRTWFPDKGSETESLAAFEKAVAEESDSKERISLAQKYEKDTGMDKKCIASRQEQLKTLIAKWRSDRDYANLKRKRYDQKEEIWEDFDLEVYHTEEHQNERYDVVSRPINLLNRDIADTKETETQPNSSVTGVVTFLMDQQAGQCKTLQFMKLDGDHDEGISLAEWKNKFGDHSVGHFSKYDTDGNGFISKAEWDRRSDMRYEKTTLGKGAASQSVAPSESGSGEQPATPQAVALEHKVISEQQFIENYGENNATQYRRISAENDGIVLQQHANNFSKEWMRQVFDRVDRDHSNQIDAEELLQLFKLFVTNSEDLDDSSEPPINLTRQMVREFSKTLNMKSIREVDEEHKQFGKEIDNDQNGVLNFDEFYEMVVTTGLFTTLADLSVIKPEVAYKEPVLSIQQLKCKLENLFDEMDENNNNYIDEKELHQGFSAHIGKWTSTNINTVDKELCKTLVSTFGQERPGSLKFEEFARMIAEGNLWRYFGLRPAPMGCISHMCTDCQGENCEYCLKHCKHQNCEFSRLWKINRYKPGGAINPFNQRIWFLKTQAALMVRDATHNMNGIYFISAEGEAGGATSWLNKIECAASIWSDEPAAVKWASTLRSAYYCTLFRIVASLLMISTAFEEPKMWSEVPTAVGIGISITCTLVIWCVFFIYMRCMWPCKQFWYRGSVEEYWVLGLGIALPLCTLGILLDATQEYQSSIATIFGEVRIDRFAMVLKVTRTYFVLFFSPTMRDGFTSAYKVWGKLYAVFGLITISFVMHYFLFVAIMSEDQYQQNIGMNEGKYKDGLWNFFVTLTTANHPDIVLQLYDSHQLSGFVLVSFMVFTQYFLMSLLLGVVSDSYSEIYNEAIQKEKKREVMILRTAFDMVKVQQNEDDAGGIDFETFSEIVSLYGDGKGDDAEMIQVWFDMMNSDGSENNNKFIDETEFKDLRMILNAPIVRKENVGKKKGGPMFPFFHTFAVTGRLSGLCGCFRPAFKEGDRVDAVYEDGKWQQASDPQMVNKFFNKDANGTTVHAVVEKVETEITELDAWVYNLPMQDDCCREVVRIFKENGWHSLSDTSEEKALGALESCADLESETWARAQVSTIVSKAFAHHTPAYPGPYYTVRYADKSCDLSKSSINLRGSGCSQINLLSYIGWEGFVDFVTIFSVIWTLFIPAGDVCNTAHGLTFEIIFTCVFIIDVIVSSLGKAYNGCPWSYFESKFQWLDVVSSIGMLVSVCLCAGDGSRQLRKVVGLVRVLRCFRLTYSLDNLKVICECALKVGARISPQLILFVIQYFAFAVIGMACFAGDVTKTTAAGGPGFWTASPYSSTAFGSTAYYYRLNFDNIGNAFATLFTQMVMNNWAVTVNGYEETNAGGRWVRIYFFIFHIFTVWLSVNILIGTIMTAYAIEYEKAIGSEDDDEADDDVRDKLLAADSGRHTHRWKISKNVTGDNRSLFAADDTDTEKRLEKLERETKERDQTRLIIKNCPLPAYITTSGGKYTLVNDAYNLLGTESRKFNHGHKAHPDLTGQAEPELLYNGMVNTRRKERQHAREQVLENGLKEYKHNEMFVLMPQNQHGQVYQENMTARTQPILTASGQPGCLTYFVSNDKKNRKLHESPSDKKSAIPAAQVVQVAAPEAGSHPEEDPVKVAAPEEDAEQM